MRNEGDLHLARRTNNIAGSGGIKTDFLSIRSTNFRTSQKDFCRKKGGLKTEIRIQFKITALSMTQTVLNQLEEGEI